MIRHLTHKVINKQRWDESITSSLNRRIYAMSWYLDIVCPGWQALVENDYETVMPLTAGKKYGTSYLYPPYFAQQLGIFSSKPLTPEKAQIVLDSIPGFFKFTEIHLNVANTFHYKGFTLKRNINLELSLRNTYDELSGNYADDITRNIKKAGKHNLLEKKDIAPEKIVSIFRKNTGKGISNLKDKNYKILLRLITTGIKKGFIETRGAFADGTLCAGVVWLNDFDRRVFLFSATDPVAKKTGAMPFLIDAYIREHAGQPLILDFEGSNLPGLARFYKGFNSMESVYLQVRKNNLPKLIRWIKERKK